MANDDKPNYARYVTIGGGLLAAAGLAYYLYNKKDSHVAQARLKNKLILFGAPGSGKGTQCEKLKAKYGMVHLSTGDLLRAIASSGTDEGNRIKEIQAKGALVPDEIVIGIVKKEMSNPEAQTKVIQFVSFLCDASQGWILDGFPRTEGQAKALTKEGLEPDNVVVLDVPDEELFKRITGRRTDPVTNKIYNIHFSPPPADIAHRVVTVYITCEFLV